MQKKVQSLKDWFPILGWDRLPNFSGCQNLSYDKFVENYYINPKLQSSLDSLITHLDSDYSNKTDTRFIGNPGAGKTTFLYWVVKLAESGNKKELSRYSFYIFHANRAKSDDYVEQIREEILSAWEQLYSQCGKSEYFEQVSLQTETSLKLKINKLSKYFRKRRSEFEKLLVFIVDDVDMLSNEEAYNILETIKADLELIQAMIWVSIRSETIQKYSPETRKLLKEMFSKSRPVESAPLSNIIQKRIEAVSGEKAKNPFSERLCDEVLYGLFEDNKRLSLEILESILCENLPKNIRDYSDESFIQNYIEKGAIKTLLLHEHIPNIHLNGLRTTNKYPLPYDVIGCLVHTGSRSIVYGSINEIAITRSRASSLRGRKIKINESDYKSTLLRMEEEGLISIEHDEIVLTNIGHVLSTRITNKSLADYYNQKCKERIQIHEGNELYWELLKPNINYRNTVETLISWDDRFVNN